MAERPGSAQVLRPEPLILLKGSAGQAECVVGRGEEEGSSGRGKGRQAEAR